MKKFICFLISYCLIFTSICIAEETIDNEGIMTLEEAIQFAVKNNSSLIDIRKNEDDQKDLYEDTKTEHRKWRDQMRKGGYSFENTNEYLTCYGYNLELAELQYKSFLGNIESTESQIKYSVKNLIYSIFELEDNKSLLESTIKKQENDLEIAKVKYKLNMVTEDDVDTAESSLESSKLQLKTLEKTIEGLWVSLKKLMGYDINKELYLEKSSYESEKLEYDDLEGVIEEALSRNISIMSSKIQYKQKENQYILATKTSFLTKEEKKDAKKNYSDAEFRLNNDISTIRENLKLLYGKVKDKESEVKIAEDELKVAKRQFAQAKIMYKIGLISRNTFLTYELNFKNTENKYKTKLKEEVLLKDRWKIAIKIGDVVE